jgi:citrate/tricarballylate utilization protein
LTTVGRTAAGAGAEGLAELDLFAEARRQFEICNSCRYCEGLCAVFPAVERRTAFLEGDVTFLASLCHDCRACYDACPYAPPHEFDVNIPLITSRIREQTYASHGWPRWLAERVDRRLSSSLALAGAAVVLVVVGTLIGAGSDRLFGTFTGAGSFYEVIPWLAMFVPFMAISLVAIAVMTYGAMAFWRTSGAGSSGDVTAAGVLEALGEMLTLRYLRGGGGGCTYPEERPTGVRRALHTLVFYGFLSAFAATVLAAFYQDVLGILPPYSILSLPVVLGSVGGLSMIVGAGGMLILKPRRQELSYSGMTNMDVAFLIILLLVNLSGMVLLAVRETWLMGITMAIHLGLTAALFVALPYGKFVHGIYRTLSLIRNQAERRT